MTSSAAGKCWVLSLWDMTRFSYLIVSKGTPEHNCSNPLVSSAQSYIYQPMSSMSFSDGTDDHTSISEGPSERGLKWSRAWRRHVHTVWPPTNADSYPILKRHRIYRNIVGQIGPATESDADSDEAIPPGDDTWRARWQKLANEKLEVFDIRSKIKRVKNRLKHARRERDAADNALMSVLRPISVNARLANTIAHTARLQEVFQRAQEARDGCQFHETALEKLEDSLTIAQDRIDLLERSLINVLRHPRGRHATLEPLEIAIEPLPQSETLLGLEFEPEKVCHPLHQSFKAALQSFRLAGKCHAELFVRKARIEEEQRRLLFLATYHPEALNYVKPPSESDLAFLLDFEMEESKVLHGIARRRSEVMNLIQLCWQENIIPQYAPLHDIQTWYVDDLSSDPDLGDNPAEGERAKTTACSVLLSNPSHLLEIFPITAESALRRAESLPESDPQKKVAVDAAVKEITIQNLVHGGRAGDTPDFINRWLLQKLRTSRHEIELLYSVVLKESSSKNDVPDVDEWQWDVLREWPRDEYGSLPPENFRYSPTPWDTDSSLKYDGSFSWYSNITGIVTEVESPPVDGVREMHSESPASGFKVSLTATTALEAPAAHQILLNS